MPIFEKEESLDRTKVDGMEICEENPEGTEIHRMCTRGDPSVHVLALSTHHKANRVPIEFEEVREANRAQTLSYQCTARF